MRITLTSGVRRRMGLQAVSPAILASAALAPQSAFAQGAGSSFVTGLGELWGYATSSFLWRGALVAVEVTALAMVLGLALGLGLALMRMSAHAPLRAISGAYIWFMRGTPLLLQLVFIFDALPLVGIRLDSFTTAVIGFALNEAAFSAEIIRGGIFSVNKNQTIAAAAFGMGRVATLRRIILPQAMRAILPGIGNNTINMLKMTSLASVIFVSELTYRAQQIVGQNFKFFTVFGATAAIYLLITSLIALGQGWLERRFDYELPRGARSGGALLGRIFGGGRKPAPADVAAREPTANPPAAAGFRPGSADGSSSGPPPFGPDDDWLASLARKAEGERPPAQDAFVKMRNVQKSYDQRVILDGIDLDVAEGEVVVLLGPSGSGKSTLLRMVNHLESMDWGEITVDGRHVGYRKVPGGLAPEGDLAKARARARIGMVFQHFNLFSHLTALENIMEAPIQVFGVPRDEAETRARKLLRLVGLANHADHLPHRLSGGQQQRVAIARALAIEPRLMLFDEPTSALDPELVGEVLAVMRRLADAGMTMIVVTHEIRFARDVADKVVFMDGGNVVEQGPPAQVIAAPRQPRTRQFLRLFDAPAGEG